MARNMLRQPVLSAKKLGINRPKTAAADGDAGGESSTLDKVGWNDGDALDEDGAHSDASADSLG